MKPLKEYLLGIDKVAPTCDCNTMVMGDKNDVIEIQFKYGDDTITQHIKYQDITHDDDCWYAHFKTKEGVEYEVKGDYTGTGYVGYSINNMVVKVGKTEIIPDVRVIPYNTLVYGTVSKHVIQI